MRSNQGLGEDMPMTDDPRDAQDVDEVRRRLEEIQRRKRGGIRWHVSKHTAEMAIGAVLAPAAGAPRPPQRSGKARRRKRRKRLL
jgi:hypothetical protein